MGDSPQQNQPHSIPQELVYGPVPQQPDIIATPYNSYTYAVPVVNQPIWSSETTVQITPSWKTKETCCVYNHGVPQELFIPTSCYNSIIASGRIASCTTSYDCNQNKTAPVLESAHYQLHWLEDSLLSMRITQAELQRFCDEAAEYCKKDIDNSRCLSRSIFLFPLLALLLIFIWALPLALTGILVLYILAIAPFIAGAFFYVYYFAKLKTYLHRVESSLFDFVDSRKQELLSRGIKPFPGPFGAYIEFKPLI